MQARTIVLDANILIRTILGTRARQLILDHAMAARFFAPDVAYADARTYLPALLQRRGIPEGPLMEVLDRLEAVVRPLTAEIYAPYRDRALDRIATRDANDWPILACAMALDCPIWTEDADFFGTGVATWTSDRVAIYLS
ncbi:MULTISPECIES: PIN domain-containing protein [Castellaniella]|uniref:PIN domain-containing protein n=1 Tax=Castellaniella TaxID=359336 RepID=UPI0039C07815